MSIYDLTRVCLRQVSVLMSVIVIIYNLFSFLVCDSLVYSCGITIIWLDGPGSNPGGDEIFRPSRPALGPTQPPVKWVPGLSWGKVRPGRAADHSPPSSAAGMEE